MSGTLRAAGIRLYVAPVGWGSCSRRHPLPRITAQPHVSWGGPGGREGSSALVRLTGAFTNAKMRIHKKLVMVPLIFVSCKDLSQNLATWFNKKQKVSEASNQ